MSKIQIISYLAAVQAPHLSVLFLSSLHSSSLAAETQTQSINQPINQSIKQLPYLTLPAGWMPAVKQIPSTEATARAQCATPTDLKVGIIS